MFYWQCCICQYSMTMVILIKKSISLALANSQRFDPLSSWWETWWHARKWGTSDVAESSVCALAGIRKTDKLSLAQALETPTLTSQWHTSSNSSISTLTKQLLLIVSFLVTKHSKLWPYGGYSYSDHHSAFWLT